jgi:hypothetical protein
MNEALWLLLGIVVPRYVRAYRRSHACRIPQAVLRAYHQSDAWRARKTRYYRTHPKVCVACLWLMPVAFYGWLLATTVRAWAVILFPLRKPLRWVTKVIRRIFKRLGMQTHHVSYASLWDGTTLHPGCEKNRHLAPLCTRLPVISRVCDGCSHHAAADRVRRFAERFGLPPVACFRIWVLKCWLTQLVCMRLIADIIWAGWLQ